MEAGAVPGGTIPPSLVPPPARLLPLPRTRSRTASTAPLQIPLHQSTPPVGGGFTSMPWITEQGGQAAGDFEQDPVEVILAELQAASDMLRPRPSSTSNKNGKEGTPTTSHDLSPAATNGSKRRSRKLTSFIWNDAEPIYIDGFLMQGRCKYCSTVFPASKVSGTSQLSRHLKVCKVKGSVDGVIHQSTPPVGGGITSVPSTTEQGEQAAGDLEQDPVGSIYVEKQTSGVVRVELQDASDVLRLRPSSRKKGKKPQGSGEACREPQWSGDARVERQNTSKTRVEQRDGSEVPISETVGGKRSLSDANESSRARKAAKTINAKGIPTTSHDLSPAATNGSKRRPRKLNSIIWNDAKPIYIDGFLMQGRCKYCSTVFPASRVSEYAAELEGVVDLSSQERNEEGVVLADSALSDWDEHVKLKKANNRNELQRYLEEDFHPRTADFDILKWWDVNSARYPILASIARDVLAVPASATASESAFSTCGRVITDHMSSLAPETVEALMCFEDWIRPDGSSSEASTPLGQ